MALARQRIFWRGISRRLALTCAWWCSCRRSGYGGMPGRESRAGSHASRNGTFADLTPQDLAAFNLIVGVDICFWEELVDPLYQLVRQGVAVVVADILVADPGRPPFDELCARSLQQGDAEVRVWTTTPVRESSQILRVGGAAYNNDPRAMSRSVSKVEGRRHRHDKASRRRTSLQVRCTAWRGDTPCCSRILRATKRDKLSESSSRVLPI
jgi:hypothetical protein